NLFCAGLTLALAYRVSGNIWFPTAAHFGWNFAQGVLFQIPVSGIQTDGLIDIQVVEGAPRWLTGGEFGMEGSILGTAAELGMFVILILAWRKQGTRPVSAETALPAEMAPQPDTQADIFVEEPVQPESDPRD
ncbi:MAG: CPBP family intramembrane metalloprotease, partial [Planctomycetes bacterium]|nr:CPBP family intramembrane metalloprotease [Planctomycetota bacterium]